MIAFMPRKWWRDNSDARTEDGFLFASLMTADKKVRSIGRVFKSSQIRRSGHAVEVPGQLSISFLPESDRGQVYRLSFEMDGLQGSLDISCSASPFSPLPMGRKPGLVRTVFGGAEVGASDFTYVSQVPRGIASGTVTLGSQRVDVLGSAYHEQGRLDDLPQGLSGGWLWFHFLHPAWNIFGYPGVFLYAQGPGGIMLSGISVLSHTYGIRNPTFAGKGPHPRVYTGGEIYFKRGDLKIRIEADPGDTTNLISFPAVDTKQIWSTSVSAARLEVEGQGEVKRLSGQIILESCWLDP